MKLKTTVKGIPETIDKFNTWVHDKVQIRAINKLALRARAEARRSIREEYNIKLSDIKIDVIRAKTSPVAKFRATARRTSLIKFKARQTGKGTSVEIKKGTRKIISSAFINQPKGKDWGKYGQRRTVSASGELVLRRKSKNAYPLEGLDTLSIGQMMRSEKTMKRIEAMAARDLKGLIQHELEFLLSGKGKR